MTKDQMDKLAILSIVFTPSAPIKKKDLFSGRTDQLAKVIDGISEVGQHIVLYGERGVGKTSLANIIHEGLRGSHAEKTTCNRNDKYDSIWKRLFDDFVISIEAKKIGFGAEPGTDTIDIKDFIPAKKKYSQTVVVNALTKLTRTIEYRFLFIIDEYDSLKDHATQEQIADTIKYLSDNTPQITVMIVGIGESVQELIGEHESLKRCLKQIYLPRMSDRELEEIIVKGLNAASLTIEENTLKGIIGLSQGYPHYTHLLAKYAGVNAVKQDLSVVGSKQLEAAIHESIENAHENIRNTYRQAIMTTKESSMFADVVYACSIADLDEHGTFRAMDIEKPLSKITGRKIVLQSYIYHLGKLCQDDRGCLLQRMGRPKQYRYRFRDPMVKAYVNLKLHEKGLP